jgi:hypothetical protein
LRHDDPVPEPEGTVRLQVFFGMGGGLWVDDGLGVGVRASRQVHRDVEAGGEAAVAFAFGRNQASRQEAQLPGVLYYVRGFSRTNPGGLRWLAIDSGLGLVATNRGTVGLTADAGASFGYAFRVGGTRAEPAGRALVYGGPVMALTLPVVRGDPVLKTRKSYAGPDQPMTTITEERHLPTTFYFGATLGAGGESAGRFSMGTTLEALMIHGISSQDEATLFGLSLSTGGAGKP